MITKKKINYNIYKLDSIILYLKLHKVTIESILIVYYLES